MNGIKLSDHFTYKKIFRFCLPSIAMMIFTSVYGVVDGFFVSNFVGKTPFAAINLIMPFLMILGGFGFMAGTGGSALVAKTLGEGDEKNACRYFTMIIKLTAVMGIILSALGIVFIRPIAYLLGAEEDMIGYCVTYGRTMLVFNTFFMLQNTFQAFFTTAEKPKMGLGVTVAAGLTNMVLDWLFIAVLKFGVAGAALATGLSQFVGGFLPFLYFARRNKSLLRLARTKTEVRVLLKACGNGSSELMTNISGSLVSMLYNAQLMKYAGENGVAAYGVLMYVQFIFIAVFIGYAIGTAPVAGYNYGAANCGELKSLLKKSFLIMGTAGIAMLGAAIFLAKTLAGIFVGYDRELFEMTVYALKIFAIVFVFAGYNIFTSSFFTALNNGGVSAAVSFLRTLVFQTVSVLILPAVFGSDGIWWAAVAAEIPAFAVSLMFLFAKKDKYHYM
ncbi:MAG: MATE family efflux transporter [Ruminococcus sp.]|nr:MATE family efflux transporter [Ruminococcus sp.]MCM1381420.1 MATE family efflux transporter [Muribaculaceae bacterium]